MTKIHPLIRTDVQNLSVWVYFLAYRPSNGEKTRVFVRFAPDGRGCRPTAVGVAGYSPGRRPWLLLVGYFQYVGCVVHDVGGVECL